MRHSRPSRPIERRNFALKFIVPPLYVALGRANRKIILLSRPAEEAYTNANPCFTGMSDANLALLKRNDLPCRQLQITAAFEHRISISPKRHIVNWEIAS